MTEYGDVWLTCVDRGRENERLVAMVADPTTLIATELLREVVEGRHHPSIEFGEGVLWCGTEGEGLGRVAYEVTDARFVDWLRGRVELDTLTMRRIA